MACELYLSKAFIKKWKQNSEGICILYEASSTKLTKDVRSELNLEGGRGRTREKAVAGRGDTREYSEV